LGTKLELENIASSRPSPANGDIIIISRVDTMFLMRKSLPVLFSIPDIIDCVSTKLKIRAVINIARMEIPIKNRKTFLAIASLSVKRVKR
jgi:hypothetical protein